jgi:hypothetical protein
MITLFCILLLVRLDLFAACGVHRSDYPYFLCGLICSPLVKCTGQIILASCVAQIVHRFVLQCFGYDLCCFIMVFISSIDVTFSWLVSTLVLR